MHSAVVFDENLENCLLFQLKTNCLFLLDLFEACKYFGALMLFAYTLVNT